MPSSSVRRSRGCGDSSRRPERRPIGLRPRGGAPPLRYRRVVMSAPKSRGEACVTATHAVLFEAAVERCDVCARAIAEGDEGASRGLYMWTRGDDVRWEELPLCEACASAVGVSATARAEIDEEEDG
jgi:hypothetical protein